jgi:hypothetical protein
MWRYGREGGFLTSSYSQEATKAWLALTRVAGEWSWTCGADDRMPIAKAISALHLAASIECSVAVVVTGLGYTNSRVQ